MDDGPESVNVPAVGAALQATPLSANAVGVAFVVPTAAVNPMPLTLFPVAILKL